MKSVSPTRAFTEGWGLCAALSALLSLAAAVHLGAHGAGSESLRALARATARSSLLLFSAASAASALRRLWPSQATAWLLRNRRYLGVSFAFSHTLHLGCVLAVVLWYPADYQTDVLALVFGAAAYGLLAAMVATSTDAAAARLGRTRWRRLHLTGVWYLHFIFAFTLVPQMMQSALYFAQGLVALGVPALRFVGRPRSRRG